MTYEIIETHSVYEKGQLKELAVLWADKNHVRATHSINKPTTGYYSLLPNAEVSEALIQKVAGQGRYIDDVQKKKYFPGKRNWSR